MASLVEKIKKTNFKNMVGIATRYQDDPFKTVVVSDKNKEITFYFNHNNISLPLDRISQMTSKNDSHDLAAALDELNQPREKRSQSYSELSGQVMLEAILTNHVSERLANEVLDTLKIKAIEVLGLSQEI